MQFHPWKAVFQAIFFQHQGNGVQSPGIGQTQLLRDRTEKNISEVKVRMTDTKTKLMSGNIGQLIEKSFLHPGIMNQRLKKILSC